MKMKKIVLFILFVFLLNLSNAQISISTYSDARPKKISGQWKTGSIKLNDGSIKEGETKVFMYSGKNIKAMKFRSKKGADAEKFKAENCKLVIWDGTHILSLPKNFKKPNKGNRFYVALYHGKNILVLYDPKANESSDGFGQGEALSVLVYKGNAVFKVSKLKFRKQIKKICSDNAAWVEKSSNKKWLKYKNLFEVAKFYDQSLK